jgi:hypothetical protein
MYLNLGLGRIQNNTHGYNRYYRYGSWPNHGTVSSLLPGPTKRTYDGYGSKFYDGADIFNPVYGGDG